VLFATDSPTTSSRRSPPANVSLIDHIVASLRGADSYRAFSDLVYAGDDAAVAVPGIVRPVLTAALFREQARPVLVAIAGEEAAARYARQLAAYLPREAVLHFPERVDMPWTDAAPDLRVVGARARALHGLSRGREVVVVASARALLRALPPRGSHVFEPLVLQAGVALGLEQVAGQLAEMGYQRVETAEEPGQFAVRGGVLDVFGADATHPVRAELFGDEVETLRRYVPSTGQSIGEEGYMEIYPCRELRLGARAATAARKALQKRASDEPSVAHHLELIEAGVYFNGIERYMPLFYKHAGILTDYLSPKTLVVVAEPRSLFDDATRRHDELASHARSAGTSLHGLFLPPAKLDLGGRQRLTLLSLLRAGGAVDAEVTARRPEVAGGEDRFLAGLRGLVDAEYSVVVAIPDRRIRARVTDAVADVGGMPAAYLAERLDEGAPSGEQSLLAPGVVHVSSADIPSGYVLPDARFAVVSIDDVYPRSSATRRAAREIDSSRLAFDFSPGDYVVHATHGIAYFREMMRKEVLGSERDYLVLEYARGDRLYVPADQIDRVTKYVGPDGAAPRVTRLNTADWSRATKKARKAARKLAFDLVDLYARRSAVEGHTFSSNTPWQLEMEAAFPYVETPDQLAAIADVKDDMESPKPMDRLICGDVGYGKTEVAIRAAFKAVQDGKQVMVLCPTTILAQQHFTTFSERFEPFPVRVDVLSRFRTRSQQAETLASFSRGEVDLLIGTHRLLSADVSPANLGLVVVDEEQRFGVQHKEHLKNLREQVDVLTLTATPIPRTLQMSLSGVRDMSIIDTAPPNRFPVQVHVGEYDSDVVSGAIRCELERGGQVYFVSNRVRTIEEAVERVQQAAPEARLGLAHGQMSEKQLERVMESFAANKYDVLVSTTIVESGIDNPHTNTLIIEDSQRLGLAQLYQLKGRVGRSHVRAFAYFLFPRGASLTEQAVERLTAIREHTELGSGIRVAMRDLEIRGAGTLLGAEQHGNMSAVGFDLYAEMLREAVAEARGEPVGEPLEVRVDLHVSALLPPEYVPAVDERVRLYRRLAGASSVEAVSQVAEELASRYGKPPEPARNLVDVARIRVLASDLGVDSVTVARRRLSIRPLEPSPEQRSLLVARGAIYRERERVLTVPLDWDASVIDAVIELLTLAGHRPTG